MNTRTFDKSTRLIGATSWAAIASGVFIALALQALLLLFGFAVAVEDARIGAGYGSWAVIVQLISIAAGAALAARLSHAGDRAGGIAAGVMTWAVALVVGGALQGVTMIGRGGGSAMAWAAFIGAALGLGAAIFGGAAGATVRGRPAGTIPTTSSGPSETPSHAPA